MSKYQKQDRSCHIGKKYGTWTVLKEIPVPKKKNWRLLCRCDCGREKDLQGTMLVSGISKSCRDCSFARQRSFGPGAKYGKWTILNYAGRVGSTCGYNAQCECGSVSFVSTTNLRKLPMHGCSECYHRWQRARIRTHPSGATGDGQTINWWHRTEYAAKVRGFTFTITLDYVLQLLSDQRWCCALSGLPIYFQGRPGRDLESSRTASLDRIDSKKGYETGNVQWVHKKINRFKLDLPEDQFIELCRLVVSHTSAGHAVVPIREG